MENVNEEFNKIIEEIEETFDALSELEYSEICHGFIYEKERIYDLLIHFLEKGQIDKSEKLVSILQRYYFGYIQWRIEELLSEEKFEELIIFEPILN